SAGAADEDAAGRGREELVDRPLLEWKEGLAKGSRVRPVSGRAAVGELVEPVEHAVGSERGDDLRAKTIKPAICPVDRAGDNQRTRPEGRDQSPHGRRLYCPP